MDKCLYNDTKSSSSPCNIDYACAPLKTALEAGNLNPSNGTQLDYCTADGGAFSGSQLDNCIQCFRSSSSQFFMSNCTQLTPCLSGINPLTNIPQFSPDCRLDVSRSLNQETSSVWAGHCSHDFKWILLPRPRIRQLPLTTTTPLTRVWLLVQS